MSVHVDIAFKMQFNDNVEMLLQDVGGRLEMGVTRGSYVGTEGKVVEQVGEAKAYKIVERHADTKLVDTPHDARWVYPDDYGWADGIDTTDQLRMGVQLQGAYTQAATMEFGRLRDEALVEAFFADSKTGKKGTTTTAFPSSQQVAVDLGGSGDEGLTFQKLLRGKKILLENGVNPRESIFFAYSAQQWEELLQITQVTSADYRNVKPLESGEVFSFIGVTFIHSELLATDSNGHQRNPMWAQSGMHLGTWNGLEIDIGPRRDKNLMTQIFAKQTMGATRLQEKKVVEIKCDLP